MHAVTIPTVVDIPENCTPESTKRFASLPPIGTTRWVPRRKAAVVVAVRDGVISLRDACLRYNLSPEEFRTWEDAIRREGLRGLKVSRRRRLKTEKAPAE